MPRRHRGLRESAHRRHRTSISGYPPWLRRARPLWPSPRGFRQDADRVRSAVSPRRRSTNSRVTTASPIVSESAAATACACFGGNPAASSRWASLSVSKAIETHPVKNARNADAVNRGGVSVSSLGETPCAAPTACSTSSRPCARRRARSPRPHSPKGSRLRCARSTATSPRCRRAGSRSRAPPGWAMCCAAASTCRR